MSTSPPAPEDDRIDDLVRSLDRSHFVAQNVTVGDHSSFRQVRHVNISLPNPSAAAQPPASVFDVPDRLAPHFLGRDGELDQIRSALEGKSDRDAPTRYIIHGMPGMGKSQLALKYANVAIQKEWYSYIFWLSGTSEDKFMQGYSGILDQIAHPITRNNPDREVRCKATKAWLESQSTGWLILLDNVNQETIVTLRNFMPRTGRKGDIICTTRTIDIAREIANAYGEQHELLELSKLSKDSSIRLLTSNLATTPEQLEEPNLKAAMEVATLTGYLPLALSQAASYIQFSGGNIQQASNAYGNSRGKVRTQHCENLSVLSLQVLKWKSADSSYYDEGSLATVYSTALNKLYETSPEAIDLLRILILLDPENLPIEMLGQGGDCAIDPGAGDEVNALEIMAGEEKIPKRFLYKRMQQKKINAKSRKVASQLEVLGSPQDISAAMRLQKVLNDEVTLHRTIKQLQSMSIILQRNGKDQNSLWLHDLVQEFLLEELLRDEQQKKFWLARTIQLLFNIRALDLKDQIIGSIRNLDLFTTHTRTLRKKLDCNNNHSMMLFYVYDEIAYFHRNIYYHKEAADMTKWVYRAMKKLLGPEHPAVLGVMAGLSDSLLGSGDLAAAEELLVPAMDALRAKPWKHSTTRLLWVVSGLGNLYKLRNQDEKAAELYMRFYSEKRLPQQGFSVEGNISFLRDLASAYEIQRKPKDAERVFRKALEFAEEHCGPESTDSAYALRTLAEYFFRRGRYEECKKSLAPAIEVLQAGGDLRAVDALNAQSLLAHVLRELGQLSEAGTLAANVVTELTALVGTEHRTTLEAMAVSAWILKQQDQLEDAIPLMERAVQSSRVVLGPDHRYTKEYCELLARWIEERARQGGDQSQD